MICLGHVEGHGCGDVEIVCFWVLILWCDTLCSAVRVHITIRIHSPTTEKVSNFSPYLHSLSSLCWLTQSFQSEAFISSAVVA